MTRTETRSIMAPMGLTYVDNKENTMYHPLDYSVSFRITHPSMNPDVLCKQLRLNAKFKWQAGTQRKTPDGEPLPGVYRDTYCCFELVHPKTVGLSEFLLKHSRKLFKHKDLLHDIRSTGGTLEYFVGWFVDKDSGEVFGLELLKQLTELGIDLSLAVYAGSRTSVSVTDKVRS